MVLDVSSPVLVFDVFSTTDNSASVIYLLFVESGTSAVVTDTDKGVTIDPSPVSVESVITVARPPPPADTKGSSAVPAPVMVTPSPT